jgi:mono/diheme cytochrome c family protein
MKRFDTRSGSLATLALGASLVLAALGAGCGSAIDSAVPTGGTGTGTGTTTGAGGGGQTTTTGGQGGAAAADGVPCDVAAVFAAKCNSCHGPTPSGGAPLSLVTYDDLAAKSGIDGKSEVERSILRMTQGTMPPGGGASAAEIATLQAWVDAGLPKGTCGGAGGGGAGGAAPDPFAAPAQCTSGDTYKWGEGDDMAPGRACNHCHQAEGEGPSMAVAGTVYPTAHEPDNCISTGVAGAIVEITGADGKVFELTVSPSSGNFRSHKGDAIVKPYKAKVKFQGKERSMGSAVSESDCNFCHTQDGAEGAPGRILLP